MNAEDDDRRIGIDVGGTKIEAVVLDGDSRVLARKRIGTPRDYDASIAAMRDLVAAMGEAAAAAAPLPVGLGIPGSISPHTGLIRNANSTWLNGRPMQRDLEDAIGRPVRLANDANCLALSEAVDGAAAGKSSVFAVILGTGCGAGLVIGGRLVEGAERIAGEIGHVSLPWPGAGEAPGPACWCGLNGCLETWISGSGFQADYERATGEAVKAQDIVERMRAGEEAAGDAFARYRGRLARALAMVVNLADPEIFVLGGGMSNVDELYEGLEEEIRSFVFADDWQGSVARARWGDSSGVRGAAWLWQEGRWPA